MSSSTRPGRQTISNPWVARVHVTARRPNAAVPLAAKALAGRDMEEVCVEAGAIANEFLVSKFDQQLGQLLR